MMKTQSKTSDGKTGVQEEGVSHADSREAEPRAALSAESITTRLIYCILLVIVLGGLTAVALMAAVNGEKVNWTAVCFILLVAVITINEIKDQIFPNKP